VSVEGGEGGCRWWRCISGLVSLEVPLPLHLMSHLLVITCRGCLVEDVHVTALIDTPSAKIWVGDT